MGKETDSREPTHPVAALDEIIQDLDRLHQDTVAGAQQLGLAVKICKELRPAWEKITDTTTLQSCEARTLVSSGGAVINAYRHEVKELQRQLNPSLKTVRYVASAADTLITATASTSSFLEGFPIFWVERSPFHDQTVREKYVERFLKFDPALGNTFKEIQEVLFGTRADPDRAALYLIRQVFDHLFSKLAPDADVRASEVWKGKEGDKSDQVWRNERIRYAIMRHVKDPARAKTLGALADHMTEVYQALNEAHKRGTLDKAKAEKSLEEMETLLREWADAVGI